MKKKILYEIAFSVLSVIAVTIAVLDISEKISLTKDSIYFYIDLSITIIFIFDYFIRLILSENKKTFVKQNIPDLIAMIPFNALKVFRLVKILKIIKIFKFVRLFSVSAKFYKSAKRFLHTNGLIYILFFTLIIILFGAVGIYFTEKNITVDSLPDAVWWSFVTATTVGYGDISPSTAIGRIIAVILMLAGIGAIGMLTGTIATYFISKRTMVNESNPIAQSIMKSTDLTDEEKEKVIDYIKYIKYLSEEQNNNA